MAAITLPIVGAHNLVGLHRVEVCCPVGRTPMRVAIGLCNPGGANDYPD
jgi:hypothetical protein